MKKNGEFVISYNIGGDQLPVQGLVMRIFHKGFSFKKSLSISTEKIAECSPQWYKTVVGVVAVLGFQILFGIMLLRMIASQENCEFPIAQNINARAINRCTISEDCVIVCTGFAAGERLADSLKFLDLERCRSGIQEMFIEGYHFPNYEMTQNWLPLIIKVFQLSVRNSKLYKIKQNAFNHDIFKRLSKLSLYHLDIFQLEYGIFNGLETLEYLHLEDLPLKEVNRDIFAPFASSLTTLQIHRLRYGLDLQNLTGSSYMQSLTIVDLRYNQFNYLNQNSFTGLTSAISLYLQSSNIMTIEPGTFNNLKYKLQALYLQDNMIKYFEKSVIDQLFTKNVFRVFLENNPWRCSCPLQWLKDYELLYPETIIGALRCDSPHNANGLLFSQVKFCESDTTSTPQSTTASVPQVTQSPTTKFTEATTLPSQDSFVSLDCTQQNYGFYRKSRKSSPTQTIQNRKHVFRILELDDGTVTVNIENGTSAATFVYFSIDPTSPQLEFESVRCFSNISSAFPISARLKDGEAYTFCAIEQDATAVSPLDCVAFRKQPSWDERAWIPNKLKVSLVASVGLGLACALCAGAVCCYYAVRRNPALLRGDRVVVVKHRAADAIVLPGKNAQPQQRRNSDSSLTSMRSYVSAVEPTALQLMNWRLDRLRDTMKNSRVADLPQNLPDTPPPLPPHPSRKKSIEDGPAI